MNIRAVYPMLAAAVIASMLGSTTSADASPALDPAAPFAAKAGLDCPLSVIGVTATQRLIIRDMTNARVDDEKTSRDRLPFDPIGFAQYDFRTIKGGYKIGIRAIRFSGRPAIVTATQRNTRAHLSFNVRLMKNSSFSATAFAGSGSYYVFTVNGAGTVLRWTTLKDRRGRIYYDDPKLVTRAAIDFPARRLRTLNFSYRKRIDGTVSDVLWGTTKGGGLQQLRIPVDHPSRAKVTTVKKRGFDGVSDISLTYCGGHPSTLAVLAIRRSEDAATWYTLSDQFTPRAKNLTKRGPAGVGADWDIHSTF